MNRATVSRFASSAPARPFNTRPFTHDYPLQPFCHRGYRCHAAVASLATVMVVLLLQAGNPYSGSPHNRGPSAG